MNEYPFNQTSGRPVITVNGAEVGWHYAKVAVWPQNRFKRFLWRRILKRPPLRYREDVRVVELSSPPPAGSVVLVSYEIES